jgi:recombination protein RecA
MYSQPSRGVPLPDAIGGGKAMRMFPSVLISLKKENTKEGTGENKKITGNLITATTLKNRIYPPFQEASVNIDYQNGINPFAGMLDLAVKAGIVEKAGAWYSCRGERLGQGEENAEKGLILFPGILEELNTWLQSTGYSTVNKNVQEAEQILQGEITVEPIDEKDKPSKRKKKETKEE